MVAIGQTITVVNKSGKVVSNSNHLVNVFKEARSAYREKKAELKAAREEAAERHIRKEYIKKHGHDEASSVASSRSSTPQPSSRRHESSKHDGAKRGPAKPKSQRSKPNMERGYSDSFYDQSSTAPPDKGKRSAASPLKHSQSTLDVERHELGRRRSDNDIMAIRRKPVASKEGPIDMDLAYGELPPPLPVRHGEEEQELRMKMTTLQKMLEEADCLQHSATTMIQNLERNPDQMAAVALALAEISSLASKMAPGALMSLKGAFPAVIALLISPEFLIAAGVGVGITVVALGGYKIVKRIQKKKNKNKGVETPEEDDDGNDLETLDGDLDRIEQWRRGIEPGQAESLGTSVDGEYVTPAVAKQLRADGVLDSKKEVKRRKEDKAAKEAAKSKEDKKEAKKKDKAPKKTKAKEEAMAEADEAEESDKKEVKKKVKVAKKTKAREEVKEDAKGEADDVDDVTEVKKKAKVPKKTKVKEEAEHSEAEDGDKKTEAKAKATSDVKKTKAKSTGDDKSAFQKLFASKKDKEVVGDYI